MEKYTIQARNKETNEVIYLSSTPSVLDVKSIEERYKLALGKGFEVFTTLVME